MAGTRPNTAGPAATTVSPGSSMQPQAVRRPWAAAPPRRGWRAVPAPLRWLGGALATLALAVAVFLWLFQWNWLRGPIADYASARLARPVAIHGNLSAHIFSWTPSLTGEEVTVGQPAWAGGGDMATFPSLTLSVDLRQLLRGRLVLPLVRAERPTITLQRDASGRNNWTFGAQTTATPQPLRLPAIQHLAIDDGQLTLSDARRKLTFTGVVSSNERVAGFGRGRFTLTGLGRLNGAAFSADIHGGTLLQVDPDKPYPFVGDIHAGATHILAQGSIRRPFDLGVMTAATHVTGPDMAELYDLTGFTLPNSPPYDLTLDLDRNDARFNLTHIHGRVGDSDVAGQLVASETNGRRDLTGALASHRLKLADLTAIIGGAPRSVMRGTVTSPLQKAEAAKLSAQGRILPDAPLDVARVRQMDADVSYKAETVDAGPLPIRQVSLHARLDHGLLTVDPLAMTLPQGALSGQLRIDARSAVPVTGLDLTLARARVEELLPAVKGAAGVSGALSARARLGGAGASVRAFAANSSGVVAVAIPQGQMRQLFAELLGLDVGKSLFLYLSHDQSPTPIRCAVAEFRDRGGVLTVDRFLIDTAAVQAEGKGWIDLRNETLNLAIEGKPKHFRLIRISAPITIKGRLDSPKMSLDLGHAAGQAAVGGLLGALVNPVAAVLPFISFGGPKDADCAALLAQTPA
ncbi:MAG TPA: AsmA family protein [Caulobacteraceae bacterium]|jgi:hypothetical protein